jgi:endonuclease YncB( thermonuclease family)
VRITDGDTIYAMSGDEKVKIRLLGFDTPESYLYDIKDYKYYGCGYPAKDFTTENLLGKTFGFYKDDEAKDVDQY